MGKDDSGADGEWVVEGKSGNKPTPNDLSHSQKGLVQCEGAKRDTLVHLNIALLVLMYFSLYYYYLFHHFLYIIITIN